MPAAAEYLVRKVKLEDLDQLETKLNALAAQHDGYRLKAYFFFPPADPTHLIITLEK